MGGWGASAALSAPACSPSRYASTEPMNLLLLQALILGVVEGLTEFRPLPSTGHLIVTGDAIGFTGERAKTFEIFIQLGSILGVVWFYRAKLTELVTGLHRKPEQRFVLNLFIAFLPAAIIGL